MKTAVALLVMSLALAGCSLGPPPPVYGDAFNGLYNQSSVSVPADKPVTVQQPVGIIFSDNVEAYFQHIKNSNEYWGKIVPTALTNNVVIADTDPNYFGGRVLAMLKRHFPDGEVVKDFNQAVLSGKKAVCLVDIQPRPLQPYGDRTTKIDVIAYFFDAQMNPVSRMSGHGERYVPIGAGDAGIQVSIDGAVQQLDAKITALVQVK
jgi:hypothetical protein